ncbi:MAG: hypothetical protein IPM55_11960 [Acidobacteria bacterium]|nr:hypothetical protein [Acidobacteriota bacterium]
MFSKNRFRSITLSLLAFGFLMVGSIVSNAQVKPDGNPGDPQLFGKSISSVDISIKKKPCSCNQNLYRVGQDGRINLGTIEEGTYTISFSIAPVAPVPDSSTVSNARMAAPTPQAPPRLTFVLEGPQSGPLVIIWDLQTGLFFNINTLSFERAPEFEITIAKNKVVSGHVAGLTIDEPGVK